jgi:hypothetical protein
MALTQQTDYAGELRDRLLSQFRGKALIEALVALVLAPQHQAQENVAFDLIRRLSLDVADGVTLDKLGSIVGQARLAGEADSVYRLKVKARMIRNRSKGTAEDLLLVARAVTPAAKLSQAQLFEFPPAGLWLQLLLLAPLTAAEAAVVSDFIQGTRAAAVWGTVVHAEGPFFAFAGNPQANGFGVGKLAGVL